MIRSKSKSFSLKDIVSSLLREAEGGKEETDLGQDSLDAQIDRYLGDYESEAKNVKTEAYDFRALTRRLLSEAEEDEKEEDSDEEKEESEESDEEGDTGGEAPKLTAEDIDMESFCASVMRLIENYDSLLEVRNTILRRAANYVAKNYENDVVDLFENELFETHGVEIGVSKSEMEDENIAPKAGAAGPVGGGA